MKYLSQLGTDDLDPTASKNMNFSLH